MKKTLDFYRRLHLAKCTRGGKHLEDNRISSLPDEVLLIILSWLTLKDMVKTSILSRRWLNLWVNTPVLDFDFDLVSCSNMICYRDIILDLAGCYRTMSNYFVRWVNHVLQQHKGLYLKKFRICCHIIYNYREDIDRWLEFALARKVEILELDFLFPGRVPFSRTPNYVLNDCWFSSGKANLDGSKSQVLQCNLKFLKSLSLKDVNVTSEAINFFLRNCPFLERLELVGSASLVDLVISDPTLVLKYLQIKQCPLCKVLSISNFNLVSLDTMVGDLILKDLPMLVELSLLSGYLRRTLSRNATCLHQLESLKLRAFESQAFTEVSSILAQLTKLKRLVIDYRACDDVCLIKLLSVIESCNYLEEFVLELHWISPEHSSRNMWMVQGLSSLSIKLFEFKGYDGCACDLELLMNVVTNAPLLEKIIIDTWDMVKRRMNYPVQEARRFALKQIEDLREAKYISPHVDVLIR